MIYNRTISKCMIERNIFDVLSAMMKPLAIISIGLLAKVVKVSLKINMTRSFKWLRSTHVCWIFLLYSLFLMFCFFLAFFRRNALKHSVRSTRSITNMYHTRWSFRRINIAVSKAIVLLRLKHVVIVHVVVFENVSKSVRHCQTRRTSHYQIIISHDTYRDRLFTIIETKLRSIIYESLIIFHMQTDPWIVSRHLSGPFVCLSKKKGRMLCRSSRSTIFVIDR
jgi:hypothetical protein